MGIHAEVLTGSFPGVIELGVATCLCIGMHCAVFSFSCIAELV